MIQAQIWPGWNIVRSVGSGGFGKVYEIRKTDSSGSYRSALKVISIPRSEDEYREYADNGYDEKSITAIFKSQVDDIVSEFKMMAQFKGTSNIVSYEDHMIVPHEDGHGWDILIRMEMLTSLPEYINQHGLTQEQVIQLGIDICRALELCAQKGIIHRDIKPQNIFVNEFGNFKLGDFGIARTMDHTTKATKTGTYSYMAPEVYSGRAYGASVDIYSLGLVLYWALNERRLPFLPLPPAVPTAAQNNEAQTKRLSGAAILPPAHGGEALKVAVLKACSFDAANRFVSPGAFSQALDACNRTKEYIISPSQSQSRGPNTNGPSKEATDYTTGAWSMKFTPPSEGGGQRQGEPTVGTWDTGSSVHWTSDSDTGHTSHRVEKTHTETHGSDPFVDAFDNIEKAQVKKKKRLPIALAIIGTFFALIIVGIIASGDQTGGVPSAATDSSPVSDEPTESAENVITYTKGEVVGGVYINEWANICFPIPDGFPEADVATYDALATQMWGNTEKVEIGYASLNELTGNQFDVFFIDSSNLVRQYAASEYLDSIISGVLSNESEFAELGIELRVDEYYDTVIAGETYSTGRVIYLYSGIEGAYLYCYIRILDDHVIAIIVSSADEGEIKDVISSITPVRNGINTSAPSGSGSRRYIDYTVGTVAGRTYVNEWVNLKLDIPEGWKIDDTSDYGYEGLYEYGLAISGVNEQGTYLVCNVEFETLLDESISSEEEYLDDMMDYIETMGVWGDRKYEKILIGGTAFTSIHYYNNLELDDDGVTLHVESQYIHKFGNRMCVIQVFNFDEFKEEQHDQFVSRFTSYDGYEGIFFGITDENGNYRPFVDSSDAAYELYNNIKNGRTETELQQEPDTLQSYVRDDAGVLSGYAMAELNARNKRLLDDYGVVIGVVTCNYGRDDLYGYALDRAEDMGLTRYDFLVVLDISGGNYWLVQGANLMDVFTDDDCGEYAWKYMENSFAIGDYNGAVFSLTQTLESWYRSYFG